MKQKYEMGNIRGYGTLYELRKDFTVHLLDEDGFETKEVRTSKKGELYFMDDNWLRGECEVALTNLLNGLYLGVGLETLEKDFIKHEIEIRIKGVFE